MKLTAKALYPAMRYFGYFDLHQYSELEDLELCEQEFDETYTYRKYDFCEAEIGVLAKYAGIHRNSMNGALDDLERNDLIQPIFSNSRWKVFLRSEDNTIWKRDYLNEKVMRSYRHIL
jgi:hypothetical protein